MPMVKVGIIGGAGYTGGELIRLLVNHPDAEITFIHSRSNAGKPVAAIHRDLAGEVSLSFTSNINEDIQVLFLCVGHGEAKTFLDNNLIPGSIKIIDLSQDHRLAASAGKFEYGLPELNRDRIKSAQNVANPGCFATAIQLGLLPLSKNGFTEIYTTGITGSTGAGQSLSETSHFSWRANNIQAYKTLTHQHLNEINESLGLNSGQLNFVPWRGDFTRGIFISSQLRTDFTMGEASRIYYDYYASHPFVTISDEPISLKQVVNTNKCMIQLEKVDSVLVVHSAIDNLLKGASGQAVQNMNIMFGLDEQAGLKLKANYF